ncbi:MAG: ATP-binding cassette domain-containing protein, partial [Gemmatimonadota bacterium]|nr:ATP-binding cassette domain-containing protein [Gemmatimonadota bacterium]
MAEPLLVIRDLHVTVEGEDIEILKGVDLTVERGQVHALMGPNGSGKSTLAKIIAGHPGYEATAGEILFEGEDILELEPDERSRAGIFLAFQYPAEI